MTRTIAVPFDSRYVDTDVFQLVDPAISKVFNSFVWGVWAPVEFEDTPEDPIHIVRTHDIGRLDLLADEFYDNVNLWWVIAYRNNIVDPWDDMSVGQRLRIHAPQVVFSTLLDFESRIQTPETSSL